MLRTYGMEMRQLRYFVTVADAGNIGVAAMRLNISQPPISRQIQALEHELRTKLFERTPRGVVLTEAGIAFRKEALRILEGVERARERVREADGGAIGKLEVAFFGSTAYRAVPIALQRFRAEYPEVDIHLSRMGKAEQVEALFNERIHIGFGRYFPDAPGTRSEVISEEPLYAALPIDSLLAARTTVTMAELSRQSMVFFPSVDRPGFADEVIGAFRTVSLKVVIGAFASDSTCALAQVAAGFGACVVPACIAALRFPTLSFAAIEDCPIMAPVSCIYRVDRTTPILDRFMNSLRAAPAQALPVR